MLAPEGEEALFEVGDRVRLTKEMRNDGTFPFAKTGEILMPEGSEGYVKKIGYFLQTIRVYEIDFIELGWVFGCREQELELVEKAF